MTLDYFPQGSAVSHLPLGKPLSNAWAGLGSAFSALFPHRPASATSHSEMGCKKETYPGAAAFLRDRLTVPCPDCLAEAEPINMFHDLGRFSCPSCHLVFLISIESLRSGSGWGKIKMATSE